jgi:hypothetical protein
MEIYVVVALICAGLGYAVASDENKVIGAVLGLILGPIGVIVAVLMKDKKKDEKE